MRKKQKRNINTIGMNNYEFDFLKEKNIYSYLCGINMNKKEIKKLSDKERMNTYSEWKQYINEKYAIYTTEKLEEFSRYLNQRIRNLQPSQQYSNIVVPILITLIATETLKFFTSLAIIESKIEIDLFYLGCLFLFFFIVVLVIAILLLPIILKVITPIWKNHLEEKMLEDYKEIIDSMIADKNK